MPAALYVHYLIHGLRTVYVNLMHCDIILRCVCPLLRLEFKA